MKHLLVFISVFLMSTLLIKAQDTLSLAPEWNVGQAWAVTVDENIKIYENNILRVDSTHSFQFNMRVVKEKDEFYILHFNYKNLFFERAYKAFNDTLGSEDDYYRLLLKYGINKNTGSRKLTNWSQIENWKEQSIKQISSKIETESPGRLNHCKMILFPLETIFSTQKSMEAYINDKIGFILFPYDKTFIQGDTIIEVETVPNPFNPMGSLKQSTHSTISNIDSKKMTCTLHVEEIIDLKDFKNMMKSMMRSMIKDLSKMTQSNDSIHNNAMQQVDDYEVSFEIDSKAEIQYDYKASIPQKILSERTFKEVTPEASRTIRSEISINFKSIKPNVQY